MPRFREPPKYDIINSTQVWIEDRKLYAFLDSQLVVQEVCGRAGKTVCRRVTSKHIEAQALSRAAEKVAAEQNSRS